MQISSDLIGKTVQLQSGSWCRVLLVKETYLFYIVRLSFGQGQTRSVVYKRNGKALFNEDFNILQELPASLSKLDCKDLLPDMKNAVITKTWIAESGEGGYNTTGVVSPEYARI
jgi:hypothetical protein